MRDAGYDIQYAVAAALSGITYNGAPVGVFDQQAPIGAEFPRILLGSISGGGPRQSKCHFGGTWTQQIKVTAYFRKDVTKNIIYNISDQIMAILVPHKGPYIYIGDNFTVYRVDGNLQGDVRYSNGTGTFIDRNISITYYITEK